MLRDYTIRSYRASDQPSLHEFLRQTWTELGRDFLPEGKDADIPNIEAVYLNGRGTFYVAEWNTTIVGSVGLRPFSEGIGELKRVYVSAAHRGHGLGRRLCLTVLADAAALGYRSIRLDTTKQSVAAVTLFRSLSFREIAPYHADRCADIFMEKTL
jgi:carbonic anhydrase